MTFFLFTILTIFRVAFIGDPQVDDAQQLQYARNSIYSELRQRGDLDLVVVLGDLVNEKPELIAPSEASLDSLHCPWVRVTGNHDGTGALRDTVIDAGHLHIILLDNVRRTRRGYEGGLRDTQKIWLDSLVRAIPVNDRLVLCAHIPFSQCKGRDSLSNIISAHPHVLMVCGHTHTVDRHVTERGMEEVLAGATCGSWWRGVRDSAGIPYALMNCGAPRGWFIADFKTGARADKWYRLSYKAVGRTDVASAFLRDGSLTVNVFGGSRDGALQVKTPKGRWTALQHHYCVAPEVEEVNALNASRTREYRKSHREEFIPLRRITSPHIWRGTVEGVTPGCSIKLRYSDKSMSFRTECTVTSFCPME